MHFVVMTRARILYLYFIYTHCFKVIKNPELVMIAQISTSVQQTTEVVALEPSAKTPWAASLV